MVSTRVPRSVGLECQFHCFSSDIPIIYYLIKSATKIQKRNDKNRINNPYINIFGYWTRYDALNDVSL